MNDVESLLSFTQCTGCGLCVNICPQRAISLVKNDLNYLIRKTNYNYCINCANCIKNCPQINKTALYETQDCYAAVLKDDYWDGRYSSAGVATYLASCFLEIIGGVVIGSIFDEKQKVVKHVIASEKKDLQKFIGSKYSESSMVEIWPILNELKKEKVKVLFIGTPCQVDAVKRFYYSDLVFTIDLVCHGVPPTGYLKEYLEYLHLSNKRFDVSFRGRDDFFFTVKTKDKIIYKRYKTEDLYFYSFLNGVTYRENCYNCIYAKKDRVGDVTLGDFWGITQTKLSETKRKSLILVNSKRGEELFDCVKGFFQIEKHSIEEAVKTNAQLNCPMDISNDRRIFVNNYKKSRSFVKSFKGTACMRNVKIARKNHIIREFKIILNKLKNR